MIMALHALHVYSVPLSSNSAIVLSLRFSHLKWVHMLQVSHIAALVSASSSHMGQQEKGSVSSWSGLGYVLSGTFLHDLHR